MRENRSIVRTVAQTAVLMAILTLISKLLGFFREMVLAGFFGTSYITDAYVMAQSIPSIIYAGVFTAIAVAYMPLFSNEIEREGNDAGNHFTSEVINILILSSLLFIAIGLIFSKQIVSIFAGGFSGETAKLTEHFLKISFMYILFTSIAGIAESYLQYKNVFLAQIIIGYTQNIIVIIGIVISYYYNYYFLAYGLLVAYVVRIFLLMVTTKKAGFHYKATLKLNHAARKIVVMSLPIFIGSSVSQINLFVDKTLASRLPAGSVAALNYANLIITLITGLTVTILTTIIYPRITQASATNNQERLNEVLYTGINVILIIAVPFSLGAILFHNEAVQLIFERGAFDQGATALTSSALLYYALGMPFLSINTIMTQTCFSKYDTRIPLKVGLASVVVNIALSLLLVGYMAHSGLALATSISYICNTLLLYNAMKRKYPETVIVQSKRKVGIIVFSSVFSVGGAFILQYLLTSTILMPITISFPLSVAFSAVFYLFMLHSFKVEEMRLLKHIIRKQE